MQIETLYNGGKRTVGSDFVSEASDVGGLSFFSLSCCEKSYEDPPLAAEIATCELREFMKAIEFISTNEKEAIPIVTIEFEK